MTRRPALRDLCQTYWPPDSCRTTCTRDTITPQRAVTNVCVLVAHGAPCLGPVTHAGCGALCPTYNRDCYGCYGPKETPNTASLSAWFGGLGVKSGETVEQLYREIRSLRIYEGATEVQQLIIARELLKEVRG